MTLSSQQCTFFQSFGYLILPGLLTDEMNWIIEEHHNVFEKNGVVHDGTKRSFLVPFFDESARLCTLFDHPNVVGVLSSLLGDDFNYVGGGGNYYSGDTNWHDDGGHRVGGLVFVKFHIYVDPLTRETGCIRMIPGSHLEGEWREQLQKVRLQAFSEDLGIGGNDVPCVAAETKPGDVVVLNHTTYHASFGGGQARRHLDLNACSRARTDAEFKDLDKFVKIIEGFKQQKETTGEEDMILSTASPERMRHLKQVIEREKHLRNAAVES